MFEISDALSLAVDRNSASNTLWTVYITVATAILAVVRVGIGKDWLTPWLRALLLVLFVAFAIANFGGIRDTFIQRGVLLDTVAALDANNTTGPEMTSIVKSFRPVQISWLFAFHVLLDIGVGLAIIFMGSDRLKLWDKERTDHWRLPHLRKSN